MKKHIKTILGGAAVAGFVLTIFWAGAAGCVLAGGSTQICGL